MSTEAKPVRVQLRRAKGWRMPANTVKVSRPSKWGNPYKVGTLVNGTFIFGALAAVALYSRWITAQIKSGNLSKDDIRRALKGKNLACWCKLGEPCHSDILLELANTPEMGGDR